jgi:DNA-binding response OmpR family regulator
MRGPGGHDLVRPSTSALPASVGLEVARTLRAETAMPIVMLTARVEEVGSAPRPRDRARNDYITKPFKPARAGGARVKAVLRRTGERREPRRPPCALGDLTLDTTA